MFHTPFSNSSPQSTYIPQLTYIEVSGLMDDFISLEETAPGSEWSDILAATWGVPSVSNAVEMRSDIMSKSPIAKAVRSFFQSFRSSLEIA